MLPFISELGGTSSELPVIDMTTAEARRGPLLTLTLESLLSRSSI